MRFKNDVYDRVQLRQMQCYQTYDLWNARNELYDKWINYSTNVFKNMVCPTICGLTKLNHECKHFKKSNSMYNNLNINEFECTLYVLFGCMYYPILQLLQMKRNYIYVFKMLY